MEQLRKTLQTQIRVVLAELDGVFTEIPSSSCDCGKPIVFTQGKKVFKCTRCGTKWELVVRVQKKK